MAKKINLNLGNLKNLLARLTKNLRWVFFAVFLFMLVLEVLQIKNSYSIVSNINQQPPVADTGKEVRINFDNYNKAVDRIQQASTFQPAGGVTNNPFATQVVLQPAP